MRAMVEGLNLTRRIVGRYRRLGLLALDLQGPQELFPGAHLDSAQELAQITRKLGVRFFASIGVGSKRSRCIRVVVNVEHVVPAAVMLASKLVATVKSGLEWIEKTYLGKGGSRGSGKVAFKNLTLDGQPFRLD